MVWWWFWIWIVFIVFLIFLPLGYGWGYRGWGPPSGPRYRYRGRRGTIVELEEIDPGTEPPPQHGVDHWGIVDDLLWLAVIAAIIWIIVWFWV